MAKIQSVEPNVADLANGWMRSYKLDYKLEQESLNTEIDRALDEYFSKNGGVGGNRPDAKLLLRDKNMVNYPVLIEYKGYKDKLVALDSEGKVANKTAKNQPDFKHNFYAKDADALDIMLPAKDGKPDYTTMETLISAVQKLVIKEVVLYANQKIETTKAVTKRYW